MKRVSTGCTWAVTAVLGLAMGGCDAAGPSASPPSAPSDNDPAYTIARVHGWYLIGNDLTPGDDELDIEVTAPEGVSTVDVWLDGGKGRRLTRDGTTFAAILDISDLEPGSHELLLAADGSGTGFARVEFQRSHPLYILVTTDWDDADNPDQSLTLQEELHEAHPALRVTHFVGPYTFTDPEMTAERQMVLADWVRGMRDQYGDEIGVHLHPWCNFVTSAGVECVTDQSVVYDAGDDTGYTILCSAYSEEELTTLLEHADELFMSHGLGKPTSFRAGGWTAVASTFQALANAGYVADSSALNWARMEEWEGQGNGVLYEWNKTHWSSIGDTSQPYYPSADDVQTTGDDAIPVLEVPDNGIMVDYVTADEMNEIFDENFSGEALDAPTTVTIGWHPPNFNPIYESALDASMRHFDRYLAADHTGPVVYETLSNMIQVWPRPE